MTVPGSREKKTHDAKGVWRSKDVLSGETMFAKPMHALKRGVSNTAENVTSSRVRTLWVGTILKKGLKTQSREQGY